MRPEPQHRSNAFRFPKLRAAETLEHYLLHMAALEWSLDAPITIRSEADIQSRRVWADRFEPYAHQIRNLITFCRRAPVALLADDVGLGKTISAGLILSELMARKKVSRTLVVAPKLLLPQWQEELATKFEIPSSIATGAQLATALQGRLTAVITTYSSLRVHLDTLRRSSFDMVVLDEAHKLRNLHGTSQPPQFALGIHRALADRVFKYVLMLTATPIQNRLWDLYSLIDLLAAAKGHSNPLGSPAAFKSQYTEDSKAVQIRRGRREAFREHLSNYIVRTRRADANLVFPERRVRTRQVHPTGVELELFDLVGELFKKSRLNGLVHSSIGQALMSSPQALAAQLSRMAQTGTVPRKFADAASALVTHDATSAKLAGLSSLIAELAKSRPEDWRLVVFTSRIETQEAIGRLLRSLAVPVGFITGSNAQQSERSIRAFRENPPGVRVLVSTDAGAEGVNLQVANVLVNFDLPWNPMTLEQRIGRVQRLASRHAEVTVLNLVLAGSVEEHVVGRLGAKLQAISDSLGDIEGILESAGTAGDDDESFESVIRTLVVESLKGLDVEKATQSALRSIEQGKAIFEAERETVEKTLGDLRELHRTGPRAPEISPVTPSVPARDFVLKALAQDGAHIRSIDSDTLSVSMPGQNDFRLTFKESALREAELRGVFGGNVPRLYLPGKRDFERLAQSWAEKSASLVIDRSRPTDGELESLLTGWLADKENVSLADFEIVQRQEGFAGELVCRSSMAVAHDRLEKLVVIPIRTHTAVEIPTAAEGEVPSRGELDTSSLGGSLPAAVAAAIGTEPDLTKFSDFYRKRLAEELLAAGDSKREPRVREHFTPIAAADAVGARGVRYALLTINAQVRVDGCGPYSTSFEVLPGPPAAARVKPLTEWAMCEVSSRSAPASAMAVCAVSGRRALHVLMSQSAVSGKLALSDLVVRCDVSGDTLLPDEAERCSLTGRCVRKGLLMESAVSGRTALPDEMQRCEFSGMLVLPEELAISDISGRRFRRDQSATSVLSGRRGHESEFVMSVLPEGLLAHDEATRSDLSGKWAASTEMVRSEKAPHRVGLASEAGRSSMSGRLVLTDELAASDVGGALALEDELAVCDVTGAKCLPSELLVSEISGRRYRNDQSTRSVMSNRTGHVTEFVESVDPQGMIASDEAERSSVSGVWVARGRLVASDCDPTRKALPGELKSSAVSGKRVLPDELEASALSGALALPHEMASCEITCDRVLPSELMVSEISRRRFRKDRCRRSAHTNREGDLSEFVTAVLPEGLIAKDEAGSSEVSGAVAAADLLVRSAKLPGRLGLPSESVTSAVSGTVVLNDEVVKSSISEALALPDELVKCEFTGASVLPVELLVSEVSGKRFRSDQALSSTLSGRKGHVSEFVKSVAPTGWLACDEAARSDLGGEWGAKSELKPSARPPHRLGLAHELVACDVTGKSLLRDEVAPSAVSGKIVDNLLLVSSAASGQLALAEEMVTCAATGRRLLPSETSICAITRKRLDNRELARSDVSRLPGRRSLMLQCEESGQRMLPSEGVRCAVSGRLIASPHVGVCAITGRSASNRSLKRCPASGSLYIDDAESREQMRKLTGTAELLSECPWTGNVVLSSRTAVCRLTRLRVERTELNASGELAVLRSLLDGAAPSALERAGQIDSSLLASIRAVNLELRSAHEGTFARAPHGRSLAACVRAKTGLLSLGSTYYGVVASFGPPLALLAGPVAGKRTAAGWLPQVPRA